MQYPPPERRPHAPSEIYRPQPPMPAQQDIAIYANHGQIIWRAVVTTICLFVMILLVILLSFLLTFSIRAVPTNESSTLTPLLITLACLLVALLVELAFLGWLTWGMWRMVLDSRKPMLFINRAGITVNRMSTLSGFSISWAEIGSISIRRLFFYKQFCIYPKNTNEFLARFHIMERLNRRSNMLFGAPPLIVPQVYLDRPCEEILHWLYYMYANELNYYQVRLQP